MKSIADNIPSKWKCVCIKEISDLLRGVTYKKADSSKVDKKGYLPILRANNINNKIVFDDLVYVPIEKIKKEQLIKAGDVIIAMSSGSKHLVGKAAQANKDMQSGFGAFCGLVRPHKYINFGYFGYFFQSPFYRESVRKHSSGININNLRRSHVEEISIPIPPPLEQNRIVCKIEELLTKLDAGIESLKQVQTLLKKYRQSFLKSAVEGKLTSIWRKKHKDELEPADKLLERILIERKEKWEAEQLANFKAKGKKTPENWQNKYKEPTPPDTSDLPELPDGWIWGKLSTIANVVSGYAFKSKDFVDNGIPVIKIANVSYGEFLWKQQQFLPKTSWEGYQAFQIIPNTILIALTRPITNDTVKACIYPENEPPALLNQRVAMVKPFKGFGKNLLVKIIQSELFKNQIKDGLSETLQPNLSPKDLSEFVIPIPSEIEQKKIIENIENIYSIIDKSKTIVTSELKRSQSLRQSILKRSFEGKLVPQDPNDEPASVLLEKIKAEKSNPKKSKQMEMF